MNSEENFITIENVEDEAQCFFFDTYAFYEIIKKNERYEKYLEAKVITTKLNLFELYHAFLKEGNESLAKSSLEKYYYFAHDFDETVIASAATLKKTLAKRDVSMTDCIGYVLAKQLGIRFLTGDEQFRDLENVEFVK